MSSAIHECPASGAIEAEMVARALAPSENHDLLATRMSQYLGMLTAVGLEMEKHYLEMLEVMFDELDEAGVLSLGLNDHLAASANVHEANVYLLQQRVKTELEN